MDSLGPSVHRNLESSRGWTDHILISARYERMCPEGG